MPSKSGITGPPIQLTAVSGRVTHGVQLRADPRNSVRVYVGYSSQVTGGFADATDGMPLAPGDAFFVQPDSINFDPSNIWLVIEGDGGSGSGSGSGSGTVGQRVFYELH